MKVLGISNPDYVGVRIATQAICSQYLPAGACTNLAAIDSESERLAASILETCPDVLVIGGWCPWYRHLLERLKYPRRFPVVCVGHGGPYHGSYFSADVRDRDVQHCLRHGLADWDAYVDPRIVSYYQQVLHRLVLFLPHAFEPRLRVSQTNRFNVGVSGNAHFHKNTKGPAAVIREYLRRNPPGELIQCQALDRSHDEFLNMLRTCSVLVHVSHLEAYPNVVQEAWSMGIPVILSSACSGLARSPLLTEEDQEQFCALMLRDSTDASELYQTLDMVRRRWEEHSKGVHTSYRHLFLRSRSYVQSVLEKVVSAHRSELLVPVLLRLEESSTGRAMLGEAALAQSGGVPAETGAVDICCGLAHESEGGFQADDRAHSALPPISAPGDTPHRSLGELRRARQPARSIWIIGNTIGIGGSERVTLYWANALAEHADVTVYCWLDDTGILRPEFHESVRILRHNSADTFLARLKKERPWMVVNNITSGVIPFAKQIAGLSCHFVQIIHSAADFSMQFLAKPLLDLSARVIAVSPECVSALAARGIPRNKLLCIPNPVDESKFTPISMEVAREAVGLPAHLPLATYIGRASPEKGLRHVPAFLAHLRKQGVPTCAVMVGLSDQGDNSHIHFWERERDKLRRLVREAQVEDLWIERPPTSNPCEYYCASDAVLLLSDKEGSPMCVAEAMACGRPLIATPVGDVRRWCVPATGSLVVRPIGNIARSAATAFLRILKRSPDNREVMSRYAREHTAASRGYQQWCRKAFKGLLQEL